MSLNLVARLMSNYEVSLSALKTAMCIWRIC